MDNNFSVIYEGTISNGEKGDFKIISPDIPELNNYIVPEFSSFSFKVALDPNYKIYTKKLINKKKEIIGTYITIVDKDF